MFVSKEFGNFYRIMQSRDNQQRAEGEIDGAKKMARTASHHIGNRVSTPNGILNSIDPTTGNLIPAYRLLVEDGIADLEGLAVIGRDMTKLVEFVEDPANPGTYDVTKISSLGE